MLKNKFIFGSGLGWSGTSSLYKTLQYTQPYINGGFVKESSYLNSIINLEPYFSSDDIRSRAFSLINLSKEEILNKSDYQLYPENYISYLNSLKKFSKEEINYFFNNPSFDKYVEYYNKILYYSKNERPAVADFSNHTIFLLLKRPQFLQTAVDKLKQKFDVKCLFILRDPIRRRFSLDNALTNIDIKNYNLTKSTDYVEIIEKSYDIFGKENVCYLIMEDFFSDNNRNEVSKLENFLNTKIFKVHPCCYVPDKGINAPKIYGLRDQWSSDREILSEELYKKFRFRDDIFQTYEKFKKFHGHLPADWGRPIDYGYN